MFICRIHVILSHFVVPFCVLLLFKLWVGDTEPVSGSPSVNFFLTFFTVASKVFRFISILLNIWS